jgi:indolepyruvate decarboxylase
MSNHGYAIEQAFVDLTAFKPGGHFAPFDDLPVWDYSALATAFGARNVCVKTVRELIGFLESLPGIQSVPVLVEVVVPKQDLPPQLERLAQAPPALLKYRRQ